MSVQGLFLDLDGTAADSLGLMRTLYEKFMMHHGLQPTDDEFNALNGPPLDEVVRLIKQSHGLPASTDLLIDEYKDLLVSEYSEVRPMPGVQALLSAARKYGWKTAIVTSSSATVANTWLHKTGIRSLIDVVITGDEVSNGKPSPEPYRLALQKTGCSADQVIAIEDSIQGAQSALSAGVDVYGLGEQDWPLEVKPVSTLHDVKGEMAIRPLPLATGTKFILDGEVPALSETLNLEMEQLWQQADALYDGNVITVADIDDKRVSCKTTQYRRVYAQMHAPDLFSDVRLKPLAVTGMITCQNGIIFGRRSASVMQDKGIWELAPSGGVEGKYFHADDELDLSQQLVVEAREELGIDLDPATIQIVAMLEDLDSGVIDIGIKVKLSMESEQIMRAYATQASREYDEIRIIPSQSLASFLAREPISAVSRKLVGMMSRPASCEREEFVNHGSR